MTGTVPFVRSLGAESGYQLNPLVDDSELPSSSISDQSFAIAARLSRGRIDKSFSVSRNNFRQRTGSAGRMDISALNEASIHIAEALNNGARNAIIARLVPDSAVISYINLYTAEITVLEPVITLGVITDVTIVNGGEYQTDGAPLTITGDGIDADIDVVVVGGVITGVTINDGGTGYTLPLTTVSYDEPTPATDGFIFKVEAGLPVTSNFVFSIKHLGCYNDGIIVKFRAEENLLGATEIDTSKVFIDVLDNKEEALFRFYGSLDAGDLDDYGESNFIGDTIDKSTSEIEFVGNPSLSALSPTSSVYGYEPATGFPRYYQSDILVAFSEGGTTYTNQNYVDAKDKLLSSEYPYEYIATGGSQATLLIAQMHYLAYETNRKLKYDISPSLDLTAAIAFSDALNLGADRTRSHLATAYWATFDSLDPTGVNGKAPIGVATLNIAFSCRRNAVKDSNGFAEKHKAIAGYEHPITRRGITQRGKALNSQDLTRLARARINPALYKVFGDNGKYIFADTLTQANVDNSLRSADAVIDCAVSIDRVIAEYGNRLLLSQPIDEAIIKMTDFLTVLFTNAQSAKWIVVSEEPELNGRSFAFTVTANAARPYDAMDTKYRLRYNGTLRQIYATQILGR